MYSLPFSDIENVFLKLQLTECKGSSELGRERKEQTPPDRDQTPSATITTSKKMLIGAMKMSLLLEIFLLRFLLNHNWTQEKRSNLQANNWAVENAEEDGVHRSQAIL